MILDEESWMNIRRFRSLLSGVRRVAGDRSGSAVCDWRTVKKYLAEDGLTGPPGGTPRAGTQPRLIDPFVGVVEAWLRADVTLKGSVIHERLVTEHGFTGSYQRV
ncbi:MAG: IS21 family transposase, partial [Tetrasphaera sp.]|nr:IS21 family transposase [Tetrasphaera sp.]